MIDFETHECHVCGEQFIVACESQLQEKLRNHKNSCNAKRTNKKRERTKQLQQRKIALYMHDVVVDRLEKHNFDNLIRRGVIV